MEHKNFSIETLQEFLTCIFDLNMRPWFRGEAKDHHSNRLVPSLFRNDHYPEQTMFYKFKCRHYAEYKHYDTFQWLCLMQHYGLPTRLLDWTTNPLVALYFSTEDLSEDGFVYLINPTELNTASDINVLLLPDHAFVKAMTQLVFCNSRTAILESEELHFASRTMRQVISDFLTNSIENPIAIIPNVTNHRLAKQSGCFTIHGNSLDTDKTVSKAISDIVPLTSIRIPKNIKPLLRLQLAYLAIDEASLFPEIEYTSKVIKSAYHI